MTNETLQAAKSTVCEFHAAFDAAGNQDLANVLAQHTSEDYFWRGMHPFYEQTGARAVVDEFWLPLRRSFTSLQRRQDVFMAGATTSTMVSRSGWPVWVT